ncbi:MAG: hypothetical protein K2K13_03080 [Clostridiales bacterium]|nr:hypothetical protein [Clostridiales bacterium]
MRKKKRRWHVSEKEQRQGFNKHLKKIYKILDDNFGKADTLVLIAPFDRRRNNIFRRNTDYKSKYPEEPYDVKYPYGKYKLKSGDGAKALNRAEEYYKNRLRELYAEQTVLPSFDVLYADIKAECLEHFKKRKLGLLGDDSWYISDLVYDGKVKYTEPYNIVWQFYDYLGGLFCNPDNCTEVVEALSVNTEELSYDYELYREPFNGLLPHLISVSPTFVWHKDSSWDLHKEFKFKYNEQTKAWILNRLNRIWCRQNQLNDFALYCGDELLFADDKDTVGMFDWRR